MSKPDHTSLTCPNCNHQFRAILWLSVTAPLNPDLRTRVLDGTIFSHVCPECRVTIEVNCDFTYSDPKLKFMIILARPKDDKLPSFPTGFLEGTASLLKDSQLRLVTSYDQLREKIRIFEAGLNDHLIELLKFYVWEKAFGTTVIPDDGVFFAMIRKRFLRSKELVFVLYPDPQRMVEGTIPFDFYAETMSRAGFDASSGAGEWKVVNHTAIRATAMGESTPSPKAKSDTVPFHVIGPDGSETHHIRIGVDIPESQYQKQADPQTGELYGITYYKDGVAETTVVPKKVWEQALTQVAEIDKAGADAMRKIRGMFDNL